MRRPTRGLHEEGRKFVVELREKIVQMLTGLCRSREHSATLSRVLVVFFSFSSSHLFSLSFPSIHRPTAVECGYSILPTFL